MVRVPNPHYSLFLQRADELRRSGALCDVVVQVQGHTFRAHSLVLACASPKLERHLGSAGRPLRRALEHLSPRAFRHVLDYVYSEAAEVPRGELVELLGAAQHLEMRRLAEQCEAQLGSPDSTRSQPQGTEAREVEEEAVSEVDRGSPVLQLSKSSSPVPQLSKSSSPVLQLSKSSSPILQLSKSSSPVPQLSKSSSPVPQLSKSSSPVLQLSKSSSPVPQLSKSSSPVPQLSKSSSPVPQLSKSSSPVPQLSKSSSPVLQLSKSSSPVLQLSKSSSPVPQLSKSSSPVLQLSKSSSPVPQLSKSSSPVLQLSKRSSSLEEASHSAPFLKDLPDQERRDHVPSASPPYKKQQCQLVPSPAPVPCRESVIASAAAGSPARSPARAPRFRWLPLGSSRRTVLNDLLAVQPLHSSSPHMLTYPYPYPTPMYPYFSRSLPPQVPCSLLGYSSLLHPYHHILRTGARELDQSLKQGLMGKSDPLDTTLTGSVPDEGERKPGGHEDKTLACQHCSKAALDSPWVQVPGTTGTGSDEASLGCKFCRRGIRDGRSMRSHRRGLAGEKPYQCEHCAKRFNLKHQLDTHHRVHTGEKPFECRLCGQRSRDYSAMIKHLRTHGGATPYQCTACLEFCSSLAAMQKHLKTHPVQDFPPDWSISRTYLYTCHT